MPGVDRVLIDAECVSEEIKKVGQKRWRSIHRKLMEGAPSSALHGALDGCYRITSGDYRCVYTYLDIPGIGKVAWVLHLGHRSDVYDEGKIIDRRG